MSAAAEETATGGRGYVSAAWRVAIDGYVEQLEGAGELSANAVDHHRRWLQRMAVSTRLEPGRLDEDALTAWLNGLDHSRGSLRNGRAVFRRFSAWAAASDTAPASRTTPLSRRYEVAVGWREAVDRFAEHSELEGLSAATVETYVRHVAWLAETVTCGPWQVTKPQVQAFLDARSWSRSTRRKVIVSLKAFFSWGVREGFMEWAPVAGLQSPSAARRGPVVRELPPDWREPVDAYLVALSGAGRAHATVELRRYHLRCLAMVAGDPWTVTLEQLDTFLGNPDWSPETRRSYRASFRSFYRWAERVGRLDKSPAEDLEAVPRPRTLPKPAPDDAVIEALGRADDRTRLAVLLAALAGLRRSEIAALHTSHIRDGVISVVGKGGHHRHVPLHPVLAEELAAEMSRRRNGGHGTGWRGDFVTESGYLFPADHHPGPITPGTMGNLISDVLPPGWSAHKLRHRFATQAYAAQRDLLAVQTLLGHSRPETTARYAGVPEGALSVAVGSIQLPTHGPRPVTVPAPLKPSELR